MQVLQCNDTTMSDGSIYIIHKTDEQPAAILSVCDVTNSYGLIHKWYHTILGWNWLP